MKRHLLLPALLGVVAVLLGAFGAHALESRLSQEALETWATANRYHFYHVLAILVVQVNGVSGSRAPLGLWTAGILFFSGGLYIHALSGLKFAAMLAPLGGLSFAAGWFALLFCSLPGKTESCESS